MAPPPDIDDLFQLPLMEFTGARNALAGRLKAEDHADEAAAVKALPKPPLSAWVVNQLYWSHRKAFDQFMAAGEQLRQAQASRLAGKGGDMHAPIEARRMALAELTKHAATLLRDAGHAPTPDMTRRITSTLEALATWGRESSVSAGRLTGDVDPPGFDALAALVPRKGGRAQATGSSRVIPFRQRGVPSHSKTLDAAGKKRQREDERKAQRVAAAAALREAERTLSDARKVAAHAEAALKKAAARAKTTEKEKAVFEKQLEKAAADFDQARHEARRVAAAAEEAAQAIADAEQALERARRAFESLS